MSTARTAKRNTGKAATKATRKSVANVQKTPAPQWPSDGWATYDDVAAFLKMSRRSVERLVKDGKLTPSQVGRRSVRFAWSMLHAYQVPATAAGEPIPT